jgi:hypothetical protein
MDDNLVAVDIVHCCMCLGGSVLGLWITRHLVQKNYNWLPAGTQKVGGVDVPTINL